MKTLQLVVLSARCILSIDFTYHFCHICLGIDVSSASENTVLLIALGFE